MNRQSLIINRQSSIPGPDLVTLDTVKESEAWKNSISKSMKAKPSRARAGVNQEGFTLIEIVATLVIIGVLAAVATTRFIDTSTISVKGAAEMIQADIRYAQETAMTEHISKSVNFSTGSSVYTFSPASGMDPSGELPSGVTIGNNFTVTFNSLGEPTAGGGGSVSISADGQSKTISISNYTGRVSID